MVLGHGAQQRRREAASVRRPKNVRTGGFEGCDHTSRRRTSETVSDSKKILRRPGR